MHDRLVRADHPSVHQSFANDVDRDCRHPGRSLQTADAIPLIRELWVGQHLNASIRSLDQIWCDEIAVLVFEQFEIHAPRFNRLSHLQCAIAVEIIERLAQYAFRTNPSGDETVLAESHDVLREYLSSFE